ncbi:MAG: YciI family protein [Thermomicrobiales bacterium]
MKYLCLIYQNEAEIDAMPEAEYEAIVSDVLEYRHELQESGHYIASSPLQSVTTATTIRVRNGKVVITDGPFAETREQLGGFYLIEAKDLNEAIRLASKMPPARIATIEVRALNVFEQELVWQGNVLAATDGGKS